MTFSIVVCTAAGLVVIYWLLWLADRYFRLKRELPPFFRAAAEHLDGRHIRSEFVIRLIPIGNAIFLRASLAHGTVDVTGDREVVRLTFLGTGKRKLGASAALITSRKAVAFNLNDLVQSVKWIARGWHGVAAPESFRGSPEARTFFYVQRDRDEVVGGMAGDLVAAFAGMAGYMAAHGADWALWIGTDELVLAAGSKEDDVRKQREYFTAMKNGEIGALLDKFMEMCRWRWDGSQWSQVPGS